MHSRQEVTKNMSVIVEISKEIEQDEVINLYRANESSLDLFN